VSRLLREEGKMKVEKEKHRVNIVCEKDCSLKGFIHINPGERVLDFINHERESFIAVTEVEYVTGEKKESVVLNKSSIKWIEEI
jgi:hypothetical protein